jgi:hypothetical protein
VKFKDDVSCSLHGQSIVMLAAWAEAAIWQGLYIKD